ncbi:hypothetical protein [Lacticaseibacillus suihuaensis]
MDKVESLLARGIREIRAGHVESGVQALGEADSLYKDLRMQDVEPSDRIAHAVIVARNIARKDTMTSLDLEALQEALD